MTGDDVSDLSLTAPLVQRRQFRVLVAVGSVAIVLAGLGTQFALHRESPVPAPALTPSAAFAVLGDPQQEVDVVHVDGVARGFRSETTRYLGLGPRGAYYLGLNLTGDVCLITLDDGLGAGCSGLPSEPGVVMTEDGAGGRDVALVTDGYAPGQGWRAVSENFLVRDV